MIFFLSFDYFMMCCCRLERKFDIGIEYGRIVGNNFGMYLLFLIQFITLINLTSLTESSL